MSDHLKKYLTTQLDLLDESSFHLQSSISDFVQQIKTRVIECIHNTSDTNMTLKDAVVVVATAQSTILEHTDKFTESTKMTGYKITPKSKSLKLTEENVSTDSTPVASHAETISRLEDIETTLTSLQDTKQKTEDDISEIKQWRDNFVTKQSDMVMKINNVSKKQKQNFKNLRKQQHEQDNKIEEMNKVIKKLEEKQSTTIKTLEELSLDLKEHEKTLHKINKEIQNHTDKTKHLTQEIKRHSDLISTTQEKLLSKHGVICQLLQQRLLPIYRILQASNRNLETNKEKLKKNESLEKDLLKLSNDFQTIANEQVKHSTPGFIASQGRWDGKRYHGYKVITFSAVERNVGNHFDPNTGIFTAPVDGLYKASLTIKQTGDRAVEAWVYHKSGRALTRLGNVNTKEKYFEASTTFEIYMKAGDVLFSFTGYRNCKCTHFSCVYLDV
ncbi:putative leucine-rich repeat-containing protein DDB_G0290503 [Physella acuta]|uniref:putative leucine-rich repeat-containing protein DDB_G0290503 n=1 Tax=Physella acuta TaxID=109671 RepID=UPI0027DBB0A8|nr:putative leucine-rich repeat-containing protein DDB_G0290503 [Physella acuta]